MKEKFKSLYIILPIIGFILKKKTSINSFLIFSVIFIILLIPDIIEVIKNRKYKSYYISNALSIFNPFLFSQSIFQGLGEIYLTLFDNKIKETKNLYELPFNKKSFANGGLDEENSHSWGLITQRFAYDLTIENSEKKSFKNKGNRLEDYYCYNQPVVSSCNGRVVRIKNNVKDYSKVGDFSVDYKTTHVAGNFIIIQHSNNEYSLYSHLRKDSITVKLGDNVKSGQIIAYCGNSGNSTEPHLHFQVMNKKSFFFGKGLIINFTNLYSSNGNEITKIKHSQSVFKK